MSKESRARARTSKPSGVPKGAAVVGIAVVLAVAAFAASRLTGGERAAAPGIAATAPAAQPGVQPVALTDAAAPGKQLLFFMNPNGYPCQTQLGILNGVADSLSKVAHVVYIKTTEPADMDKFEAYGIRALPMLVIADNTGRELSRFSPGIQSSDAVLAALTK